MEKLPHFKKREQEGCQNEQRSQLNSLHPWHSRWRFICACLGRREVESSWAEFSLGNNILRQSLLRSNIRWRSVHCMLDLVHAQIRAHRLMLNVSSALLETHCPDLSPYWYWRISGSPWKSSLPKSKEKPNMISFYYSSFPGVQETTLF